MIYIGDENIISPLGDNLSENFKSVIAGESGVQKHDSVGYSGADFYVSRFPKGKYTFETLLNRILDLQSYSNVLSESRTKLIFSTTKGAIDESLNGAMTSFLDSVISKYNIKSNPLVLSNACISGVEAMIKGHQLIQAGLYDNVVVVGIDLASDFILYGFESLYAMDSDQCKPYDKERKGINLGECAASVLLSNNQSVFSNTPVKLLGGAISNDANHISGPSRTGEGLFRVINNALSTSGKISKDVDLISAHGTATLYNDEMESIAFERLEMRNIPIHSLKSYFGHSLGAAGVVESCIAIQCLKNNLIVKSRGFNEQGTTHSLSVITENQEKELNTVIKTASGFGGGNAAIVFEK